MNISTLFSRANFMPNHTPVFKRGNIPSNISTLVGGLSTEPHTGTHQLIQGPNIHLRMKGENCIYSGGRFSDSATFQNIYAEYTSDSTAEDPVVRISGTAESGKFDFICHIRDIDPSNASYAELSTSATAAHTRPNSEAKQSVYFLVEWSAVIYYKSRISLEDSITLPHRQLKVILDRNLVLLSMRTQRNC